MADEIKREVIVDVRIEKADTEKQVTTLTQKITALKTQNQDLLKTNKELEKSGKANSKEYIENAKQIEINKQKITENTASRKSLITTINAEENSIKALQARNKELIKQRNEISTATAEGRAQIAIMNQEIDKNNETIKNNVSGLEKQKINIGNYASALDNVIPGLGKYVQGTQAMTVASNTFIATPIGAIIGAIGLALAALIAYFKGSEEGQDRLNRLMNIGGAIMEKVMDVVEKFGGAIFDAFENPKQALSDLVDFLGDNFLNRIKAFGVIWEGILDLDFKKIANGTIQLSTGITDSLDKLQAFGDEVASQADDALKRAEILSRLQERLNRQERDLVVARARTERDVAKLIVESQELEGEARLAKINEAIALEKKLLETEKAIADTRLGIARQTVEDDPTIENKKAYAEAVAGQAKAELDFFNGIRRLDRQRISAQEEAQKERLELLENHLEAEHELYLADKARRDAARAEEEGIEQRFEERLARETKARKDQYDKDAKNRKAANDKKVKAEEDYNRSIADLLGQAANLFHENTVAHKVLAVAETTMNTYIGASKAMATYGFPLGPIFAAIMVAQGLANVAKINGVEFAKGGKVPGYAGGGLSGTKIQSHHGTPINRSNGDNRLATVRTGEVILNERQQAALGGDATFRNIGVPGFADGGFTGANATNSANRSIQNSIDIRNLASLINQVKVAVVLQDFEIAQSAKNEPINRARVIA